MVKAEFDNLINKDSKKIHVIGIIDDVTNLDIPVGKEFDPTNDPTKS